MDLLDVGKVAAGSIADDVNRLGRSAAEGDGLALTQLLTHPEFRRRVKQICNKICFTSVLISPEDLEQDFYIRVLRKISGFRGESTFETWMTIVIRRLYFDLIRKQKRQQAQIEEGNGLLELESLDSPLRRLALNQTYERLSESERALLRMRATGAKLIDIAVAFDLKTKQGKPSTKIACQELNAVLKKLVSSISDVR